MSPWPHKTGPFLKFFLIFDSFPIIYSPSCCAKELSNKGGGGDFRSSTTVDKREEVTK